jgi:hypothetical protein
MAVRKRGACVTLMLTPPEKEQFKTAAGKADMPLSAFIRTLALMALKSGETLVVVRAKA